MYDPIYMPFQRSSEIPYILKPNLKKVRAFGNLINTDERGLRSSNPGGQVHKKEISEYRIAFIGDSVTFGVAVPFKKTYPEIIETCLNRMQSRYKIKVFNYGTPAYSIKEMSATLRYRVNDINPDMVIIGIILDDFDSNRTPGIDKYGVQCYRKTNEIFYDSWIKSLILNNTYLSYLKNILRNLHVSYLIRDVVFKYNKYQKNSDQLYKNYFNGMIHNNYKYIIDLKYAATNMQVPYLIVLLPSIDCHENYEWQEIIDKMNNDQVDYCNLLFLSEKYNRNQFKASKFDMHPSALIHKEIGEGLCIYIIHNIL